MNTMAFPWRDARQRQALPSCPVLPRRFASRFSASDLASCPRNKSPACRYSRAAEKIFHGSRAADLPHRVVSRNFRRWKKSLTADYADFADSKECRFKTDLVSEICVNLRNLRTNNLFWRLHELDVCSVGITNVNDALAGIRTGF